MLFDLKKVANRKNASAFILFALISFYFVYSGISGYQAFLEEKNNFIQYENLKVKQYQNYEQYGSYGFRLLFQPPIISIFFNGSLLKMTETQIDTKEIIKINNSRKGRSLFYGIGNIKGLSDFIFFFGSLFVLYLGLTAFTSLKEIQFYKRNRTAVKAILNRLLYIILFSLLLFVFIFLFAAANGVNFSNSGLNKYFHQILYTMLFLSFFYVSGLLISVVTIKNKKLTFRIAFLFWIILIVLIPELSKKFTENRANRIQSIEKINIEKLNTVMDFERKAMETYLEKIKKGNVDQLKLKREIISDYVNGGFKANEKIENELHNEVKGMVFFLEKFSLIFPTTYYPFLADEISGEGYYSYLSFFDSIKQIRRNFMKFYSDKRNFSKRTAVESFIKKDENIFKAKPHLPKTFWLAITILLALNSILLLFTLKKTKYYLKQNRKKPFNSPFDFQKIKVGNVYYIFCGNEIQRDNLFDSLKGNETISIDPLTLDDFDPNIKLKNFLHLAEKIENTNTEKLHTYLQKLDIPSEMLNKRIEEVPFETFKKFFCAVKFANQQNYIIISDYARGSSKDFNHKFRSLLADINKEEGKTILYLSSEMFDLLSVRLKAEEIRENSLYQVYPIDDITTIAL